MSIVTYAAMIPSVPAMMRVKPSQRRKIDAILRSAYRKFAKDKTSRQAVKRVLISPCCKHA
jgi:hypothetical protein